jgi:tripartite-type tricarboxylate transporter receptor subunit TctC
MLTRILQAATILLCSAVGAVAQTPYPSRTVTMMVAFNAGDRPT